MAFSDSEKAALLAVKGIGPTVIQRFEQIGINSLDELARYDALTIAEMVADMLNTTCWKNSPQARAAVAAAIARAKVGL